MIYIIYLYNNNKFNYIINYCFTLLHLLYYCYSNCQQAFLIPKTKDFPLILKIKILLYIDLNQHLDFLILPKIFRFSLIYVNLQNGELALESILSNIN